MNEVGDTFKCPVCGEADEDRLVWIDDERVRCVTCSAVYVPGKSSERPFSTN